MYAGGFFIRRPGEYASPFDICPAAISASSRGYDPSHETCPFDAFSTDIRI
jgi:hypothetical protein